MRNFGRSALAAVSCIFATSAWSVTWDLPTPYGKDNFHTVNVERFAADIEQASAGALTIKVHPAGSLFPHAEIKDAVRRGRAPLGEFLMSRLADESAIFAVDSVPFLATTYFHARKLWNASRPAVGRHLSKQGLQALFAVPWPPQGFYLSRPAAMLEEFRGLKIRTYNASTERLVKMMGARSVRTEPDGIAAAFTNGGVEAMITSPTTGGEARVWTFTKYYYHTQTSLPKNVVVANRQALDALEPRLRRVVLDAAERAEQRGWLASEAEVETRLDGLRANGMVVSGPPRRLELELRDLGRRMTFEWTDRSLDEGIGIIERYYALD